MYVSNYACIYVCAERTEYIAIQKTHHNMYVSYTMHACVYVCIEFAFKNLDVLDSTVNTWTHYREMVWFNSTWQEIACTDLKLEYKTLV